MLHKEIPFLRIGLPLCIGIISGLYVKPDTVFLVPVTIVIALLFFTSYFFNKFQTNLIFGFFLTISMFTCGLLLYSYEKTSISSLNSEQSLFHCTLSCYPEEKTNSIMLTVNLNGKINPEGLEVVKGSMVLYSRKDSSVTSLVPGDMLIIKCTPVEITNRGNPNEFDYKFYMENRGIRYYAFTGSQDIIRHIVPTRRKLVHRALIIREKIIGKYKEYGITGERLALVAAITLGEKNMLDPEQKQNFIKAGVMHIMAVSGLHAVILSLFVFNLLFFLKKKFNILRVLITILILWLFAFVTGLTPSVLRATLMFSFLQAGNLMKRRVNGINSVLASAFVLIMIRPSVIFDAGFLLSYSAVIYIICFYQDLYLKLQLKNWFPDKIWQSAVVTIVAQAGTLPLTIMLFNRFPTYFILSNIIIVPLSSLLIVIGCLFPLTFPVPFFARILASILNKLTGLTELLTSKAASLPYSTIENIGMTTPECILLTLTIFLFIYLLLNKNAYSIKYPLIILLAYFFSGTVRELSTRTSNEVIVFNTTKVSTIGIRTGKLINIYSDTTFIWPDVKRYCATYGLKTKTIPLENNNYFIRAGEKNIIISKSINNYVLQKYEPEIVVLTGKKPQIESSLPFAEFPETLIVTSEVTAGFQIPFQRFFSGIDTIHLVGKSGAFRRRI